MRVDVHISVYMSHNMCVCICYTICAYTNTYIHVYITQKANVLHVLLRLLWTSHLDFGGGKYAMN